MTWWLWLLLGIALLLIELLTPGGFYFIFFGIGAIVVALLSAAEWGIAPWFEWLLFAGFSIAALLLFREPLLRKIRVHTTHDVDALIGEVAIAINPMDPGGVGKAEMRGAAWNARNVGASQILVGQRCRVERVDGLQLHIRAQA
jgi:membrane protein implicated in regulation of membrane protease activity